MKKLSAKQKRGREKNLENHCIIAWKKNGEVNRINISDLNGIFSPALS